MSDHTSGHDSNDATGATSPSESAQPDADAPVGDMTEHGQTEVGPHPELTDIENMEQADLAEVAKDEGDQ